MLARISNNLPLVRSHQHTVAASARILLAVLLATLAAPLNADEGFPYRAVVETANASVQSGPGIEFYAEDKRISVVAPFFAELRVQMGPLRRWMIRSQHCLL